MNLSNKLILANHFIRARWRWEHLQGKALERYQESRARRIVMYTVQHSAYYADHWAGHSLHDWESLPMVDKSLMMEHFDSFNTCGVKREEAMKVALEAERSRDFSSTLHGLTVGLSSGTSGHRGLFLASSWEQTAWAGTILARTLHHLPRKQLRVAFFLRSNSNLYEHVGGKIICFRYFDLMMPLAEAVSTLRVFQPHIIIGPPSLLDFLAEEQRSGHLQCKPERLISVAEVLEHQVQERIEETFNVQVHQIYQCTEGLLAVSCEKGSLHIQEDIVKMQLEALPDSNGERFVPIITDLWRRTQPIIRYRLNDVLQMNHKLCGCGSTYRVIHAIEGRCDDICYFTAIEGGTRPFYPDTIRRMILLASPDIEDYRVLQERPGQLILYLKVSRTASFGKVAQSVVASVHITLEQYNCRQAEVIIEKGLPIQVPGEKLRRVRALRG